MYYSVVSPANIILIKNTRTQWANQRTVKLKIFLLFSYNAQATTLKIDFKYEFFLLSCIFNFVKWKDEKLIIQKC